MSDIKKLDLEVCCTLGMLSEEQAMQLKEAGLDAYNHNLDTSREHYPKVTSTRTSNPNPKPNPNPNYPKVMSTHTSSPNPNPNP